MRIEDVARDLALSRYKSDTGIIDHYRENFLPIQRAINGASGLKTSIRFNAELDSLDILRFLSFSHDYTRLCLEGNNKMQLSMLAPNRPFKEFLGVDRLAVTVSAEQHAKLPIRDGRLDAMPTLSMPSDEVSKRMIETISPLMESGHLIVEPRRGLMTLQKHSETEGGPRTFHLLDIDQNSAFDNWSVIDDVKTNDTIPFMKSSTHEIGENKLFQISFPFLSGVPFSDLAKILQDEHDYVSQARNTLKEIVSKADVEDISGLVNDVLRPKLDSLERRFRTISNVSSMRQFGAAVGAAAITLLAYYTKTVPEVITTAVGGGGLGLVIKQHADLIEKRDALREDPHYLLWRLNKIGRQEV